MLKVVVFDGGFGGELFADYIERELAVVDVIRVIVWRDLDKLTKNPKTARQVTETALARYIGRADVIVLANHLVSTLDLSYFRYKYPQQKFLGFSFPNPKTKTAVILTTKALHSSSAYRAMVHKMKTKIKTVDCDDWVPLVDDAELTEDQVRHDLADVKDFSPGSIVLAHTNFVDIKKMLIKVFGPHVRFEDGFKETFKNLVSVLGFRGLDGRKYE